MELFPVLNEFDTFNMATLRLEIINKNLGNQAEKILEQDFRARLSKVKITKGKALKARLQRIKSSTSKA